MEKRELLAYVQASNAPRQAWEDITWAALNSKEFLLRH
jgi:hypothetical protein